MHIEHLALWTLRLEQMREFYTAHFECTAGPRYVNPTTGFSSYFLSFASGVRLELMTRPDVTANRTGSPAAGYAHLAIAVGSEDRVRALTESLRAQGVTVQSAPRRTGDGYFESVILDPDGNPIELTV